MSENQELSEIIQKVHLQVAAPRKNISRDETLLQNVVGVPMM